MANSETSFEGREKKAVAQMLTSPNVGAYDKLTLKDVHRHYEDQKNNKTHMKSQRAEMARYWQDQMQQRFKQQ